MGRLLERCKEFNPFHCGLRIGHGTFQIHLPPLFRALLLLVALNLWLHLLWLLVILPPLLASAVLLLMWSPHLNLFLLPRPAALLLLMRPAPDLVLLWLLPAHALAVLHASTPEVFDFTASDRPSRPSSCLSPGPAYNGPPLEDSNANTWPFSNCPDWPINNDWLRFAFAPVTFTVDEDAVESTSFSLKTILCLDNDSKT